MAKKRGNPNFVPDFFPPSTRVEVVKLDLKGEFVGKKEMLYSEWKVLKRQAGFNYRAFQLKFSQFKEK